MFSQLFSICLLSIYLSQTQSQEEDIKVKSLCEDPFIHSADRLVNRTVRVYRGQYYWQLVGLPAQTVKVEGPFKIWNLNMGTFTMNNALVTILEGTDVGSTYKTDGQRYWAWDKNGKQFAGAVRGNFWDLIPVGGFEAAFHDGDKNNPTVVGFKGIHVYYFSTKDKVWTGDKKGYISGKYGENFPTDLTAAFSWPSDDPKDGYIAYLFKRKNHCKRTKFVKEGENCQWIDNKVLFGCPVVNVRVNPIDNPQANLTTDNTSESTSEQGEKEGIIELEPKTSNDSQTSKEPQTTVPTEKVTSRCPQSVYAPSLSFTFILICLKYFKFI